MKSVVLKVLSWVFVALAFLLVIFTADIMSGVVGIGPPQQRSNGSGAFTAVILYAFMVWVFLLSVFYRKMEPETRPIFISLLFMSFVNPLTVLILAVFNAMSGGLISVIFIFIFIFCIGSSFRSGDVVNKKSRK